MVALPNIQVHYKYFNHQKESNEKCLIQREKKCFVEVDCQISLDPYRF